MAVAPPPSTELIDDATAEILLRLPPDEPACLVRASLVCRSWRQLLTGHAFLRRYREFHRAAPMLGFFRNIYDDGPSARFVTTTSVSPFSTLASNRINGRVIECRHGRVLLHSFDGHDPTRLIVWDPITGHQQRVPVPAHPYYYQTAAVLCSADGCDHLDCHGGHFQLVFFGYYDEENDEEDLMWARVYSLETGEWSALSSIKHFAYIEQSPSLLAGDALYLSLLQGKMILKYDLVGRGLQVIDAPKMYEQTEGIVVTAEDGGLGLAGVKDGNLYLWSWQAGPEGIAEWVQSRVININMLLPVLVPFAQIYVIGFAEGTDTIFINTHAGAYAIIPKSGQAKKVGETGFYYAVSPYMRFYTPDLAVGSLPPP